MKYQKGDIIVEITDASTAAAYKKAGYVEVKANTEQDQPVMQKATKQRARK